MTIFWFNLAIVFVFSFMARIASRASISSTATLSSVYIKPNKTLAFVVLITLVCVSGLRSNIGDTYAYVDIYKRHDFTWNYILESKDIGFGVLQMILKYFSSNPQIMLITTAIITNVLVIFTLYNYSRIFELSVYVYITGGLFLVSMNGIRQVLAASIAFAGIRLLLEGSFKRYLLVILLASLFHQTALILIPIYFLVRFKAWSKVTIALLLFSIVFIIGFNQLSTYLFNAIQDTQYAVYKNFQEGGASVIRVAVTGIPLLIAFMGREKLREINPKSDIVVNMALLGFVFMLISTQNWIFARISIYFSFYQLILISWIVKLFRVRDQKLIYYGILICYFFYYYYENVISLQIQYFSDYINLNW
ncbi:EpsG family protein [Bacillus sp. AFS088145]|uniref:EpsG family protein n=1 Tax=Bacillus sp. AFS088145 TaxID=2033514 RepID=UPI000BF5450C|nr:EpsG family protein [Bacillus sp. AFS088145]PFH85590.1 capsular biosynthesis protein [Bacillus sp. AFS088145]